MGLLAVPLNAHIVDGQVGVRLGLETARARRNGSRGVPAGGGEIGGDPLDDLVVVDGSGHGHDQGVGGVGPLIVLPHRLARHGGNGLVSTADRPAQRGVIAEGGAGEGLLGDVDGIVRGVRQLGDDDAALGLDLRGVERGGGHHVGQDVESLHGVRPLHARVVGGVLLGGGGVGLPADEVECLGDLTGRASGGALEHEVLEEMGRALLARDLVPGPDSEPHAQARRAQPGHGLGDDAHPAGQDRTAQSGAVVGQVQLGAGSAGSTACEIDLRITGGARPGGTVG